MKLISLVGQRFGSLRAIERVGRKNSYAMWKCVCDCGQTVDVRSRALITGNTKSCGCYRRQRTSENRTTHGHRKRREQTQYYSAWINMHQRCYNPNNYKFPDYGGRGIQVCVRWHRSTPMAFENFLSDMGGKPTPKHSIDRINNDWSYMPSNCRWATATEQAANRRGVEA